MKTNCLRIPVFRESVAVAVDLARSRPVAHRRPHSLLWTRIVGYRAMGITREQHEKMEMRHVLLFSFLATPHDDHSARFQGSRNAHFFRRLLWRPAEKINQTVRTEIVCFEPAFDFIKRKRRRGDLHKNLYFLLLNYRKKNK